MSASAPSCPMCWIPSFGCSTKGSGNRNRDSDGRLMARDETSTFKGTAISGAPVIVVDRFLPADLAEAMRADIDAHFATPQDHRAETHQIWNYLFVPELYAYLRTRPEKVFRRDRVDSFMRAVQGWSVPTLGMGSVTWPYLSLYISGCRQGWHNDALNGRFGF